MMIKKIFVLMVIFFFQFSLVILADSGVSSYNSIDYNTVFKELMPLAKSGNNIAQNHIAAMFANGLGVKKNYKKAFFWFNKAAKNNNPAAINNLGVMYYHGLGVNQDKRKGVELYKQASEYNEPAALNNYGYMYINGNYVEKNVDKGISMIAKAAEGNDLNAQYNMALIYYKGEHGVKINFDKAFYWVKKASNGNYNKAQCLLSKMYFEGTALKQDLRKSYYWAYISMQNGYAPAGKVVNYLSTKLTNKEKQTERSLADKWLNTQPVSSFATQILSLTAK